MQILELIKNKITWIIFATFIFYVIFILISDAEKISEHFLQIRLDLLFLIFLLVFLSHVVKSFRQKELLHILGEKISSTQNFIIYMAGLSLINTPGGVGTFIKSYYLKEKSQIPVEKSISVIFWERYHDLLAGTSIILASLLMYFSLISISLIIISTIILIGVYLLMRNWKFSLILYRKLSKTNFIAKNFPDFGPSKSFSILANSKNMTKGWFLSVFGWVIDSLAVYVVFLALNVDLGYLLTSQIYFTSLGYGALSLLPGGIGVHESMADFLLLQEGLELHVASSLVVLSRFFTIWLATIFGVVFTRFAIKK
ncbi:MAG: flippase-like domain-containing protein [Nitrosopumilus sp.]|nr:flippase-like domain-containing protein [Nitrosopumilus sp.]